MNSFKRRKSNNIVINDTKISQKIKNKSWLSIEKHIIKRDKKPHCNYKLITRNNFYLRNLVLLEVRVVYSFKLDIVSGLSEMCGQG